MHSRQVVVSFLVDLHLSFEDISLGYIVEHVDPSDSPWTNASTGQDGNKSGGRMTQKRGVKRKRTVEHTPFDDCV